LVAPTDSHLGKLRGKRMARHSETAKALLKAAGLVTEMVQTMDIRWVWMKDCSLAMRLGLPMEC
jgi:hypothetical protein